DFTTPAAVDGTSMAAFSVSSVISGVSISILSPAFTRTSMTSTFLKSPRSGTVMSCTMGSLLGDRVRPLGIDVELLHARLHGCHVELAFVGERAQRSQHDVLRVDFEVAAQLRPGIAAAVAVGAEHDEASGHPLTDLVWNDLHVVARGDERTGAIAEAL